MHGSPVITPFHSLPWTLPPTPYLPLLGPLPRVSGPISEMRRRCTTLTCPPPPPAPGLEIPGGHRGLPEVNPAPFCSHVPLPCCSVCICPLRNKSLIPPPRPPHSCWRPQCPQLPTRRSWAPPAKTLLLGLPDHKWPPSAASVSLATALCFPPAQLGGDRVLLPVVKWLCRYQHREGAAVSTALLLPRPGWVSSCLSPPACLPHIHLPLEDH